MLIAIKIVRGASSQRRTNSGFKGVIEGIQGLGTFHELFAHSGEFSRKAVDVVGLYLNPPQNAMVLCVDEKPCIQALERAQGWIRLPNGRSLTGFAHEYKHHGT
jgi:hypothetical protein